MKVGGSALAGAALLGVAGCGGSGSQGNPGTTAFTFSFGPDTSGSLEEIVRRFNEKFEGRYRAKYRVMAADTGQYFNQVKTEFQAGGGEIDLIGGDVVWPAQFAANGWIEDLSARFTEEERQAFLPAPVESCTYEDGVYGVPWFTDAGMLYYRKDLLEGNGFSEPPKTWEELKEQAVKVTRDSGTEDGFVFQGAQYEGGVVNGLEYIWTAGGDVIDPEDPEKVVIDAPGAVEGLAIERSMIEDGVAPKAVSTYAEQECQAAFLNGRAAFCRNWPYMYALASEEGQSRIGPGQVGVAPLPVAAGRDNSFSGLGGWNFYLNAASSEEEKDAAYEFVKFATAPEQQKFRALNGSFLPTLKDLYEDREVVEKVPVIALGEGAIKNARPRPLSPYYSDMSLKMAEQFNACVKGDKSPEEAVGTLDRELQEIVDLGETS
ncbi:MAG: Maltodextrin ABC transporter, substrate-binding protein MdxE [uncultured Rubrobacteraceae bacterium]|uniref:Maltodextrin ABC transporter, substrate-binding protein MdxE n=1 Tax=uncultured Rubrobacteraceae bacterium TaxID=349277 RepID=A0A6J4PY47_9ACTN|nr:MAG: Maltodextrin ABC transporter, substrate-binding protein MdxE [uncultured Rubrobacteraceae bacterium]